MPLLMLDLDNTLIDRASNVSLHRQGAWSLPGFGPAKIMGTCAEAIESLIPGG